MEFVRNIDLVRFDVQYGNIYFPLNTHFQNRKINAFYFYYLSNSSDPVTGKNFVTNTNNMYLFLRDKQKNQIIDGAPISLMKVDNDTIFVTIDSEIDFENSYIKVTAPTTGILFCYVSYGVEEYVNKNLIFNDLTIHFPTGTYNLDKFISSHFYGKIYSISSNSSKSFFLDLKTKTTANFELLTSDFFMKNGVGRKQNTLMLNGIIPDFQRSTIYSYSDVDLTFKYKI